MDILKQQMENKDKNLEQPEEDITILRENIQDLEGNLNNVD